MIILKEKEMIIINIINEFGNRLFRGYNLTEVQSSKLRRIKYPGLIMSIIKWIRTLKDN